MALEEGLTVKLVLIPDKEDPDSYVNKVGAEVFRDFIAANKKDFILFQLEVSLKDAGTDSNKKATVVNQVAETIARINKAEDFTKQQDYIRQCSELLKIEETGLHTLVNKFIRERISKQENKLSVDESKFQEEQAQQPSYFEEDSFNLLFKDELHERAMIRSLLEFGLKSWDENARVADYIFGESIDHDMIDNKKLVRIMETYKTWYGEGIEPTQKNFLYHEDQELSALVVSIMDFPYEISPNWKEHYEGKINTREDLYKEEVFSTLNYLKLRKIKRLIDMNQKDLERQHSSDEQMMLMQTHQHLKMMERELLHSVGTVIVK
jgi:DNA primase